MSTREFSLWKCKDHYYYKNPSIKRYAEGRRITPAKPAKDAKLHLDNQSSWREKRTPKTFNFLGVAYY